jgi:hypothetical protein
MFKILKRLWRRPPKATEPELRVESTDDPSIMLVNGSRVRVVSREVALMITDPQLGHR